MKATRPVLLFDLDGTLTDNSEGIIDGTRLGLAAVGIHQVSDDDVRAAIGPPLRSMFASWGLSTNDVGLAVAAYRAHYTEVGILMNRVYAGIPAALADLGATHRLAVATSKPEVFAIRILEHFDLAGHFDKIGGATIDGARETKASVVRHTLASLDIEATSAVMIGDRRHDIEGSRAEGVERSVGVSWGFGSAQELIDAGATPIVDSPEQLRSALSDEQFRPSTRSRQRLNTNLLAHE